MPGNTSELIRKYAAYRRADLESQRQALQLRQASGISMGSLMKFDHDAEIIQRVLGEIDMLADWLEAGAPEFVPPLSDSEKQQWRFARDRGAEVPEHILAQL